MRKDSSTKSTSHFKPFWLLTSITVLIALLLLPTPESLPLMAKSALAILLFAVILWVTEAVTYPVSAVMIVGLIILLIGYSPVQNLSESRGHPQTNREILKGNSLFGTGNALKLAFSGFSTSALALVAAALFLATALQITQLHKILALIVLSVAGNKTSRIVIGTI
ncbi:anion permease, partial [Staphylococcus aureus]|uniref:anion permease n=1 Tax=Staphylococcus aureus TaxID=1280 RepID=UPI002176100D